DHELFMAVPVYNSIKNPTTKAVFVYMSAGDAGQTNGWWEAREVGTVAATKTWVNLFGQYAPTIRTETVLLQGHHIQKVSVGNAVHYFIRLTEDGYRAVLASQRRAPIDQPTEFYDNVQALKNTLKAIILAEATKVPRVSATYSEHLDQDPSLPSDHDMHYSSGQLTAEMLNADPLFRNCVSQSPFYGYQHWLDAVNMNGPEASAQRAVWLNLDVAIRSIHGRKVWSEHSAALGRSYPGQALNKPSACQF
ncbi:hypothetical protein As57867_004127, partial [Aphanomyces stellatus]